MDFAPVRPVGRPRGDQLSPNPVLTPCDARFSPEKVGVGLATLFKVLGKRGYTLSGGGKVGMTFSKLGGEEDKEVQFVVNNVVVRRRTRKTGYRCPSKKIKYGWYTTHIGYIAEVGERKGKLTNINKVKRKGCL